MRYADRAGRQRDSAYAESPPKTLTSHLGRRIFNERFTSGDCYTEKTRKIELGGCCIAGTISFQWLKKGKLGSSSRPL